MCPHKISFINYPFEYKLLPLFLTWAENKLGLQLYLAILSAEKYHFLELISCLNVQFLPFSILAWSLLVYCLAFGETYTVHTKYKHLLNSFLSSPVAECPENQINNGWVDFTRWPESLLFLLTNSVVSSFQIKCEHGRNILGRLKEESLS